MNRRRLAGLHGRIIRLRPLPRRFDARIGWLPSIDDHWRVEAAGAHQAPVRASNLATGHFIDLTADNVFEFREPDVVVLKAQLTLTARQVRSEPMPDPRARYVAPEATANTTRVQGRPAAPASLFEGIVLGVGIGLMLGAPSHRRR